MNGSWIRRPEGELSIVFVHGILSSSECWKCRNGTYWPNLLAEEKHLTAAGIYVYEYKTGFFSGTYRLGDIVDNLYAQMQLDGVSNSRDIVFICHSMGGIVVRRFIVRNILELVSEDKRIGLFLIASPSLGAEYANWLAPLAKFFKHSQADALRFTQTNSWLMDLDIDFKDIKESNKLDLRGKELVEDTFIALKRFGFFPQVVEPFSGAKYFGKPLKIPNSDHFSIAKVPDADAIQHRLLLEFLEPFEAAYAVETSQVVKSTTTSDNVLRFSDEVYGDPVSAKLIILSYESGERNFEIEWPSLMSECLDCLQKYLGDAKNHLDSTSIFHDSDPTEVADFVGFATAALKRSHRIRNGAPKRIPYFIAGTKKYWGDMTGLFEISIVNYLTLANYEAMRSVLYCLTYKRIRQESFPEQLSWWFESEKDVYKKIFQEEYPDDRDLYSARIYELCGENIQKSGGAGEHFWGPAWMIKEAIDAQGEDKPIINPWFRLYLIPQNELRLAEEGSDHQFHYNSRAKIGKVTNSNGEQIY